NGGSTQYDSDETSVVRAGEARESARIIGATWHPPITDDLEIFYDEKLLRKVAAVIREVKPSIVLTHPVEDYMEDHMNTSRLAVTAAFSRGMPNYRTSPRRQPVQTPVTVYHANPHGLRDGLRRRIIPGAFIDTSAVHECKRAALACHASQKAWLDATQGMDSYLVAMDEFSRAVAALSGEFQHAEGWRRHSHLGFCGEADDPLRTALGSRFLLNPNYEQMLERGY
ncbi:MAG: LmbE family protein, partial [Verrucomicrobiaceae bacterium]